MTKKIIRGSGGPPSTPPSPTRAPDTLNSRQFATIQDLLSEGEIEGFATPSKAGLTKGTTAYNNAALKDIFLNDTPILQSNANNANPETEKFNFQNVNFTPRFGTGNQDHIPGIQQSQSPLAGFGPVLCSKSGGGITRALPTGKDAVRITVTFAQIQKATDEGDLLGSTVEVKVSLRTNNDVSFTEQFIDKITGRTADAYSKDYRVELPNNYTSADIKIERVTDDQTPGGQIVDAFNVSGLQLLIDDKQQYLNSAYTSLRIDSEQFSSIPKRAFRIRGVKVRIPGAGANNTPAPTVDNATGRIIYDPTYIFNGTMGAAVWCSCPAMILLDLLVTKRYGFGTQISPDQSTDAKTYENLDLFSFVAASRYANEEVSDGFGGLEARFSCNVNLQGSMEAYTLINELAGVMRCFPIWSEGSVTLARDEPTDPSYLFSLANVGEGGFSYSGSSLKQRHSIISVSYFNMDSKEIDYEVVGDNVSGPDALQEDIDRQAKLGIVKKDIKAFACTSRGQARRLGKAVLLSEEQETEVVSFTTSIDAGAIVRPGSVISVNDPVRSVERRAGRIKSATTTQITVDNDIDLDTYSGNDKKCSVILPDGSVETKDVTAVNTGVITLNSALSATPNANSVWLLQSSDLVSQTFRVITVEEQDGINYAITALKYNYDYVTGESPKYSAIDSMQGITLPDRTISLLNQPRNPPGNLQASERIVVINALAVSKLILSWVSETGVSQYLVQYRFNNTNWVSEIVFRPDFEIFNTEAGTYEFKVYSYNAALVLSSTSSDLTFAAVGKTTPPGNVQNLSMEPITNKLVRLRWTKAVDPDVLHGGRVYVRHSNLTDGTGTFQNSVDLVTALAGNTTDVIVPSLEGEYILKFQDDQGNFSLGEASVIQDLPDLIDTQVIIDGSDSREDLTTPPFQGTKTNTTFSTQTDALQLTDPSVVKTGTYVQNNGSDANVAGTVITITSTSHGIAVGELLKFNFTGGEAVTGEYSVVSVPNANTLTITSLNSVVTNGNVSIDRGLRGEYAFNEIEDLGAVFSLDLKRVIRSVGFVIGSDIETIIPAGSFWDDYATDGNFDGQAADEANCQILVATSQTASGSFGPFNNFANGTFKGRRFKFKLILETTSIAQNMNVQQAGFTAEFQSRTEQNYQTGGTISAAPQSSGTSAKTVTFGTPFFVGTSSLGGLRAFMPSIGITIENAQSGDFFTLSQPQDSNAGKQFTISIKNGSSFVDRTFTFQAVGYGKGV
jgi:predicted phage tail protein